MRLDIPENGYRAVIFDCDGTLVDSMPLHYEAWLWALRRNGFPYPFTRDRHYANAGLSIPVTVAQLNREFGTSVDAEAVNRDRTRYVVEHHRSVRPVRPVLDFACSLEGRFPMGVASGSEPEIVASTLAHLGAGHLFAVVVTPADVPPGRGKPHPDMFLLAAERLGICPAECLVFEDGQSGIDAARAAGMRTVFVPSRPDAPPRQQ